MKYYLIHCRYMCFNYDDKLHHFAIKISEYTRTNRFYIHLYSNNKINISKSEILKLLSLNFPLLEDYINVFNITSLDGVISVSVGSSLMSDVISIYLRLKTCIVYGNKLLNKRQLSAFKNFKIKSTCKHNVDRMFANITNEIDALFVNGEMISTDCKTTSVSIKLDKNLKYNRIGLYFKESCIHY